MRRLLPLSLAFLVACSGGPGGIALTPPAQGIAFDALASRQKTRMPLSMQVSIPRRHHREGMRPGTISPSTHSISVTVNKTTPQVFNTTATSKDCKATATTVVCRFDILVAGGKNTLVVKTYSGTNASGYVLDQATAVRRVTSTTRAVGIVLGPVISNAKDSGPGSLRQALTDANAGDTLMYVGTTPATITMTGGTIALTKNVTINGPGAAKLTISANNASQVFSVPAGVTAVFSGLTITKGTSSANAGAIANAGTLTLSDDTISNSTAGTAGGAVDNSGMLTSTSNTYSGNTALDGGAINNTGTLRVMSDTYTGNNTVGAGVGPSIIIASRPAPMPRRPRLKRAHLRGARRAPPPMVKQVFPKDNMRPRPAGGNVPDGGAIFNGTAGTMSVSQSAFSSNGSQQGTGGAIFSASTASGWTIANDTFTSNTAAYGGAVAVDTTGTLTSDTFTTNSGYPGNGGLIAPYGYGGAVYASAALTVTNCTFTGNVAGGGTQAGAFGYGGAIEADNAALTVSGSHFSSNVAGGANSSGSSGQGGAIDTTSSVAQAVSITNSTFTSNTAGGGTAGTSYGYGGAVDTETYNTLAINGSTFTSNTAGGNGYGDGGAIIADAAITGGTDTFSMNSATGTSTLQNVFGGAIDSTSTINLSGSSFSQNTVSGGSGVSAGGGAIITTNTLTIDSSTFTSNSVSAPGSSAVEGGAIQDTNPITITNSTFTSNSLTTGATTSSFADGGAVDNQNSVVTISGSTFTSNSVSGGAGAFVYGGAAECDAPGTTLTNDTFSKNTATATGALSLANGGAVYLVGASTIANGTFSQNSASTPNYTQGWGGAVNGGSVTFSGTVTGNSASNQGAGLYVGGGTTITNSTISGNTVTTAGAAALPTPDGGGGINEQGGSLAVTGSTISGNSVAGTGLGGGILNTGGTPTFTNDTIANNTSSVDGGGVEDIGGTATGSSFLNATLYGNTATSGNGGNWNNQATPSSPGSFTNSIAGGGTAGGTGADICNGGSFNDGDYNVYQTVAACGGTILGSPTHNTTANPLLSALASNGGPTQTMADSSSSPGYNKIPIVTGSCNNTGVTKDQRGNLRGSLNVSGTHANCDSGAYETP